MCIKADAPQKYAVWKKDFPDLILLFLLNKQLVINLWNYNSMTN